MYDWTIEMTSTPWTGKSAIVCGGSDGLGLELARQLAAQSIGHLLLLARNADKLQKVVAELQTQFPGVRVAGRVVDMSHADQVKQLAEALRTPGDSSTPVDLLIQAVGQSDRGALQDLTKTRLLELLEVNLFTGLNAVNELSALMARPSTLVLIGSLASHFAPRFLGGYAIAKHALAALAQQSRLELAERGIHVLLASPGPIARDDAGIRYRSTQVAAHVPAEALQPGGGARLKGLDPERLARDILRAAAQKKLLVLFPAKAGWLRVVASLFPGLGDRLLRKNSS